MSFACVFFSHTRFTADLSIVADEGVGMYHKIFVYETIFTLPCLSLSVSSCLFLSYSLPMEGGV